MALENARKLAILLATVAASIVACAAPAEVAETPTPRPAPTARAATLTPAPSSTPTREAILLAEGNHTAGQTQETEHVRAALEMEPVVEANGSPTLHGRFVVGVERAANSAGESAEVVVVRTRGSGRIVLRAADWQGDPAGWVVAPERGAWQVPYLVTARWAEIPSELRLLPENAPTWVVGYAGDDGTVGEFFFARGDNREVIGAWSLKGLYAASRLPQPEGVAEVLWADPPDVETTDLAVNAWIEEMLRTDGEGSLVHFASSAGYPLDSAYLRETLELVKLMKAEERAFLLSFSQQVDFWDRRGNFWDGTVAHLDARYLENGLGPASQVVLVGALLHEAGVHQTQDENCTKSRNKEHQAWYLQYVAQRRMIEQSVDPHFREVLERGSYLTCYYLE
jgi:hypothetical protein